MIGLDTNVLIRYLTQDDADQAEVANQAIELLTIAEPGYLSVVTLAEIHWVLWHTYRFKTAEILRVLEEVVSTDEFSVESPVIVRRALHSATAGADFADALLAESCRQAGCAEVLTFDKNAAKQLGFRLIG